MALLNFWTRVLRQFNGFAQGRPDRLDQASPDDKTANVSTDPPAGSAAEPSERVLPQLVGGRYWTLQPSTSAPDSPRASRADSPFVDSSGHATAWAQGISVPGVYGRSSEAQRPGGSAPRRPADFAESFRLLALTVERLNELGKLKTILVMGAYPGDGRTTTVNHLGLALAEMGRRVILVEADGQQAGLSRLLSADGNRPATASPPAPAEQFFLSPELVHETTNPHLGLVRHSSLGLAEAEPTAWEALLARLRPAADYIILDSPPCLKNADAFFLAPIVDGVIYVVRRRAQDVEAQRTIQARLTRLGATVLGVVFNER